VDPNSNPYWSEDDVDLTSARPLTSLTVILRVSGGPGAVSRNNSFTSAPGTSVSITAEGDGLVYRWTLDAGRTLAPGTYTFAGQFDHAKGERSSAGDRYTVSGAGESGPAAADGGF
jgi:hypothetical protein